MTHPPTTHPPTEQPPVTHSPVPQPPPTQPPGNHDRLGEAVRTRRERRARWQREGERSLGRNLAMIGALGWTIVVPTLAGVFAGRWLDRRFGSGIFWTLGLLVAGLAVGCTFAWRRMHDE